MAFSFKIGKLVTMVTGGASGLGRATAEHFVKTGGRVAILDLPSSKGEEVAKNLGSEKCSFFPVDILDTEGVMDAIDATTDKFGSLQVLVNCAGIATARKIYNFGRNKPHELDVFQKILDVNVAGTMNVIRCAIPKLSENEQDVNGQRGVIINTASIAAYDGQAGQVAYAASKGAIASMTLPLARDLSSKGIRTMTIAPGLFRTEMLAALPDKIVNFLQSQIPFPQRFGEPKEYAMLVQTIVENVMLNGEVIRLDAGLRMAH